MSVILGAASRGRCVVGAPGGGCMPAAGTTRREADVDTRRSTRSSSAICRDVLTTLEQIFVAEGPDEPDLGLNIAYTASRTSLRRLEKAEPWELPQYAVRTIRRLLAEVAEIHDPEALETQLLSLPGRVLRLVERRRNRVRPRSIGHLRRAGDRPELHVVVAGPPMQSRQPPLAPHGGA